jgi:four helix bundle protein
MASIKNFEELEVWKLSMELCTEVYRLTNTELFSKDFGLKDQIRRSAVSVPSNISEGYERDGKNQFLYFLAISKGSCGELRTQLRIAFNLSYINENDFNILNEVAIKTSKQLSGFIKYLKSFNEKKLVKN